MTQRWGCNVRDSTRSYGSPWVKKIADTCRLLPSFVAGNFCPGEYDPPSL